jgi:hypothetical protein
VSDPGGRGLRVALVGGGGELVAGLRVAGHRPLLVAERELAPVEALLAVRGFTGSLTAVPSVLAALLRSRADVAEAFSPAAAVGALGWRRLTGRPVVFTCTEPLERGGLADRRLRLRTLAAAVEDSDALLAADEATRAALRRWMAVEAPVAGPQDTATRERLYRELLGAPPAA